MKTSINYKTEDGRYITLTHKPSAVTLIVDFKPLDIPKNIWEEMVETLNKGIANDNI